LLVALFVAMVAGWTQVLGARVLWSLLAGVAAAVLCAGLLWFLMQRSGDGQAWVRERFWAKDDGTYHAFGGVGLRIEDDGRYMWMDGRGLLRVLGRQEPDDVLAARVPGQWRHTEQGVLMLRVDAVVQYLAHMPGRDDLRVQKLRRYLERDVLYPAEQRRRRH
jgi:hypothetical protein